MTPISPRSSGVWGTSAIVTTLLDLSASGSMTHGVVPSVVRAFAGKALGHEPADADGFSKSPIPTQRIESVVSVGVRT
ncbi:hypothetical protein ACFRCI_49700 [Streptomyces sp. NPDC056638]|uniref:hypothetical protein n=1 Tax=Streptomyces sp. NPDC056638 TaxID=3345887 RepID=UPI0036CAE404